jgi:hypothetical protein
MVQDFAPREVSCGPIAGNPTGPAQECIQASFVEDSILAVRHEYNPQVPTQRSERLGVGEGDIDCLTSYPVHPSYQST